jgi:phosphate transport system protein
MQIEEQPPPTTERAAADAQRGVDPGEGHTSRTVDQSLSDLRLRVVAMGGLVIEQVAGCVKALVERDARLAEVVLQRETLVNAYDGRLDRDTLTFIALQQPVASDLRMVRAIGRAALELERIGDEAKKIARFASRAGAAGGHDPIVALSRYLRHMGELSVAMLRSAVRALDEGDASLARQVLARDKELDAEFATALRQLMSFVMQDHQFLRATLDTVFALKGLERIGDHAKNVAEQALYMTGADAEPDGDT